MIQIEISIIFQVRYLIYIIIIITIKVVGILRVLQTILFE